MMNNQNVPIITLDGPSGTGKGTIACMLAKKLGWHFLDSGAIYRVLAYAAKANGISITDTAHLVNLSHALNLSFQIEGDNNRTVLNDKEISQEIRSEECGQDASKVATLPEVRVALLARQRAFAQPPGLVTDGRDMGSVVFPTANLKLYLYATAEARAHRRYLQLKEKGNYVSLAQVVDELEKRDARDIARTFSPLKPAEDAVLIDTTRLSIVQVFGNVLQLMNERLKHL